MLNNTRELGKVLLCIARSAVKELLDIHEHKKKNDCHRNWEQNEKHRPIFDSLSTLEIIPTKTTKVPTLFFPLAVKRTSEKRDEIAIVVIVGNKNNAKEYFFPQATLHCYAQALNYTMLEVSLEQSPQYVQACPGKDFMFQRHCVMAMLMEEHPEIEWFAFLDADIGVVNPNHLIEEYTHPDADLIFYTRLWNYEITSGAYLVRNTKFSRFFLRHWADYEHKVIPGTLHGTDNGAVQQVFLDFFCSSCAPRRREECTKIWHNSHNYDDLFNYESCARELLGPAEWFKAPNGTVRQLSFGRGYWSRDGWLTDSKWSDDDFMFHGWKEYKRNGEWKSMFTVEDFDPAYCNDSSTVHLNFAYKPEFYGDNKEIQKHVLKAGYKSYNEHLQRLQKIVQIHLKEAGI
ncbi:hypothetical protein M3Y98_00061200 [Aphelenchoides besseyi]|nr:hypothetical protein M3Y98_00061200 [Aphelenchoides besseyi]